MNKAEGKRQKLEVRRTFEVGRAGRRLLPSDFRLTSALCLLTSALVASSCVMHVENEGQVEREEKRFTVGGTPVQLRLSTFDGSVEVRAWDRQEILVQIDKRGQDKEALSKIEVLSEQKADAITVDTKNSGRGSFGIGFHLSPSARLIASVPRNTHLLIRTPDGSVLVERVTGRTEIHTDDGSIHAIETAGEILAETGDGSIQLEEVSGHVEARTADGSIRVSGMPGRLRVRSGDGSIALRVRGGTAMTADWMVATDDGSITLELPEGFAAEIEADPGSDGRVRSDLKLTNASGGTRESRVLTGGLGQGGRRLVVKTGDGTIRLVHY